MFEDLSAFVDAVFQGLTSIFNLYTGSVLDVYKRQALCRSFPLILIIAPVACAVLFLLARSMGFTVSFPVT